LFTAPLDTPHTFTTIEQGTGNGFFVFELTAAEKVAMQAAVFAGGNFANDRVGLSTLLDMTSNDGAETFGAASVVPEPGFYGVLALGLSTLCLAVQRSRRKRV